MLLTQALLARPEPALPDRQRDQNDKRQDRRRSKDGQQGKRIVLQPQPLRIYKIHHAPSESTT